MTCEGRHGENGAGLRQADYTANAVNQYSSRTVPNKRDLIGSAATMTVNNEPVYRHGNYFWKEMTLDNSTAPVWATEQVVAVLLGAGTNGTDIVSQENRELTLQQTPDYALCRPVKGHLHKAHHGSRN